MMKYVYAVLGGGLLLFIFAMFFPTLNDATGNTTIAMGNTSNFDGLANFVTFSPLLLWMAFFVLPVVIIAVYLWQRRQRAGG